jgi:thiamine-phosphate pyrophosphorylase
MIINDRPDIAVLSSADGVHVGQEELSVADVRAIVGPKRLIGVSTHSIEQARQAVLDGADYIGCGPTFPTSTKEFSRYPGLEFLVEVSAEISLPGFAIGGINRQRLSEVLETGVGRIAVSSALDQAEDPFDEAEQLLQRLREAIDPADLA